ncbi:MAG: amino acid ABC transporter permease [Steroidobacteraceae bacterium]
MSTSDLQFVLQSLPPLLKGLRVTLFLTLLAGTVGILCAVALALVRLSRIRPLAWLAFAYVSLFRAIPLLLVLFWIYLLVPMLTNYTMGALESAIIGLTMFEAAYYSEIIRAGIQAVPAGQTESALATGLTRMQAMRFIVLPQAARKMAPILLSQSILLFMDTSVVFVLGIHDFMGTANIIAARDARVTPMYLVVALVYFIVSLAGSQAVSTAQSRRLAPAQLRL